MSELSIYLEAFGDDKTIVHLSGFLNAATFENLDNELNNLIANGKKQIIVDLANLEFISSSGVGVFIGISSAIAEGGGKLLLAAPGDRVKEVMELLGLNEIFTITSTLEEAREKLK